MDWIPKIKLNWSPIKKKYTSDKFSNFLDGRIIKIVSAVVLQWPPSKHYKMHIKNDQTFNNTIAQIARVWEMSDLLME